MSVVYTKESLIRRLREIRSQGWFKGGRPGNAGSVGNTLEDLLGIKENNLPIPNAAEWELKCQRNETSSLTTMFHMEPSPTAFKFVSNILLPKYGWRHKKAGDLYPATEKSFRQTISCMRRSDRGFGVIIDRRERKVLISFDAASVSERHKEWLNNINKSIGGSELNPQPYWGFDDLYHKAATKLYNCFYVAADTKVEDGVELFRYSKILKLSSFSLNKLISMMENGDIFVDFDARTGHNHGTKFRFKNDKLPDLYDDVSEL